MHIGALVVLRVTTTTSEGMVNAVIVDYNPHVTRDTACFTLLSGAPVQTMRDVPIHKRVLIIISNVYYVQTSIGVRIRHSVPMQVHAQMRTGAFQGRQTRTRAVNTIMLSHVYEIARTNRPVLSC